MTIERIADTLPQEETPPGTVYPARVVAQERLMLRADDALSLAALSHHGWAGRRDLREGARILVAGEGNADATVLLAEQARGTQIEIVAIDTNPEALALSKARLAQRGLTNVAHKQLSLMELAGAGLGTFDIIECSNVLDHLEDPIAGLAALVPALAEDGILVLKLNATYGRLQLFMVQALLQYLIEDYMPRELKLQIVQEFLSALPADHWLGHDSNDFIEEIAASDGSIEALFLQHYNHTFTVAEIYQAMDACGLALLDFVGPRKAEYEPLTHNHAKLMRELFKNRESYERHIIADMMGAGLRTHQFYAAQNDKTPATFAEDMIITLAPSVHHPDELKPLAPPSANRDALLAAIDGVTPVSGLLSIAPYDELEALYNALHLHQKLFLRHQSIPPYPGNAEIQARLSNIAPISYQ